MRRQCRARGLCTSRPPLSRSARPGADRRSGLVTWRPRRAERLGRQVGDGGKGVSPSGRLGGTVPRVRLLPSIGPRSLLRGPANRPAAPSIRRWVEAGDKRAKGLAPSFFRVRRPARARESRFDRGRRQRIARPNRPERHSFNGAPSRGAPRADSSGRHCSPSDTNRLLCANSGRRRTVRPTRPLRFFPAVPARSGTAGGRQERTCAATTLR